MFTAGMDIGSVAAKAVILGPNKELLGRAVRPTGWNSRESGESVLDAALARAGLEREALACIVGTGYGRVALPFAQKSVTEITCHAKGAAHLFPATGIVLDIGGQDSKVVSLESAGSGQDACGAVRDFVMNDKCAAGTGRFLQVLSGILGMSLEELGQAAGRGRPVSISSMCAVFAETEIIGLLARGGAPDDIASGVFLSIVRRITALSKRIAMHGECTFTGGLAQSPAFCSMLSKELGMPVNVSADPQIMGALGAALLARDLAAKNSSVSAFPAGAAVNQ